MLKYKISDRKNDIAEFGSVILLIFVYTALNNFIIGRGEGFNAETRWIRIAYDIGATGLFWSILSRNKEWLPPLPENLLGWLKEIGLGIFWFWFLWLIQPGVSGALDAAGVAHDPVVHSSYYEIIKAKGGAAVVPEIVGTFFGATREEVICRAYVIYRFGLFFKGGFWPVFLSALLFAISHGYSIRQTIIVFISGVVWGTVYYSSHKLPRTIVAHWLFNIYVLASYVG